MDLNFSLADSELESYSYSFPENKLVLKIKIWDESVAIFSFTDPVLHIDRFRNEISDLRILENSKILEDTIKTIYEVIPKYHPYKLYQFLDLNDLPCIEIICTEFTIEKN